jgi:prepilin-type N-terminal cleavage/methylation domain-containing protein
MMRPIPNRRRGFTIVEIITALTIIAILGIAMTKLVIGQARSFQMDNGGRKARAAARSAMNILITDLRMTQDSGGITALDATNNRRIDVRVPIVFGTVCSFTASGAILALVPVDSFQMAAAKYGGYAVRRSGGSFTYQYSAAGSGDTIQTQGNGSCHGGPKLYADTVTVSGRTGRVVSVSPGPPAGTAVGDMAFVYQDVTYEFKTSQMYPGGLGLYRVIRGRANTDTLSEELLAPFTTTSRFNYYMSSGVAGTGYATADRPTATTPAATAYHLVRGFQIVLAAQSPDTTPGRTKPQTATTTTAVFFKNTRVQ